MPFRKNAKNEPRDLFSVKHHKKSGKRKHKRLKSEEDEEEELKKAAESDVSWIAFLSYANIVEGQVILGCIQEVREYELLVNLPHMVSGVVPITHISTQYAKLLKEFTEQGDDNEILTLPELFTVGQYVTTVVSSIKVVSGSKMVYLSLRPCDINKLLSASVLEVGCVIQCTVESIEDNGYVMECGIKAVRAAFLPKSEVDGVVGIGCVLRCVITHKVKCGGDGSRENSTIVRLKLSADPSVVADSVLTVDGPLRLGSLIPGTAVETYIEKIEKAFIKVFLVNFSGYISSYHLRKTFDEVSNYHPGQLIKARVLYISPLSHTVYLTLVPSVCSERKGKRKPSIQVGKTVMEVEVYMEESSGIFFKLGEDCKGFCSNKHLAASIKGPATVSDVYIVGSRHLCKVIRYSMIDELYILSFEKSVIEETVLSYEEVEVGQIMKGTIQSYEDGGAQISLGSHVVGFASTVHLTDSSMKNPEGMHPVHSSVMVRVLRANPQRKLLHVTCKKQLIKSKHPIVKDYSDEYINTVTEGCVVKIMEKGLIVELYNFINGFVPKRLAGYAAEQDLSAVFTVGQVLKCQVVEVIPERNNVVLSLTISEPSTESVPAKSKGKKRKKKAT